VWAWSQPPSKKDSSGRSDVLIDERTDRVQHGPVHLLNASGGRFRDVDMNVDLNPDHAAIAARERDRHQALRPRGRKRRDNIR